MAQVATYNSTFLNGLFTTREFEFINHMDSDIQKIDSMLASEEHNRDLIVTFISNLHDASSQDLSDTLVKLLADVENTFALVNENIELLHTKKQYSDEINKSVVDLLIKAESENNAKDKFAQEILELKNKISNYSNFVDESNSKIFLNDIKIDNFIKQNIEKEYVESFSLNVNQSTPQTTKVPAESKPVLEQPYTDTCGFAESNSTLLVSEKQKRVYLPYSKKEILKYLEQYPNQYSSFEDVVRQEFILPLDFYMKHTVIARFRETYALIRDRESKSIIEAFKQAMDMMFRYDLNPAIIAACKTQDQLENYLSCLERKKLDEFTDFEIRFELMPMKK